MMVKWFRQARKRKKGRKRKKTGRGREKILRRIKMEFGRERN